MGGSGTTRSAGGGGGTARSASGGGGTTRCVGEWRGMSGGVSGTTRSACCNRMGHLFVRYSCDNHERAAVGVLLPGCGERQACSSSKAMGRTIYKMLTHVGVSDT